jgi:hypothetical protein
MPEFLHDCDTCVYLGKYVTEGEHFDLYYHPERRGSNMATIIARFGNEGAEYLSGLESGRSSNIPETYPLREAYRRAVARGLIDTKPKRPRLLQRVAVVGNGDHAVLWIVGLLELIEGAVAVATFGRWTWEGKTAFIFSSDYEAIGGAPSWWSAMGVAWRAWRKRTRT